MRESKRTLILDAAARVVQRDGIKSVTYDTVAAESGLTKGGLVYHFPSREEMIVALHEHLAGLWEASMVAQAGKPAADASVTERLEAYARASIQSSTRAELLLLIEGSTTAEYSQAWNDVLDRWTPSAPTDLGDHTAVEQFMARLAADGLWLHDALAPEPLDQGLREQLAELITERIQGDPGTARP